MSGVCVTAIASAFARACSVDGHRKAISRWMRAARSLVLVSMLALPACSTVPGDAALDDGDPLEGLNRTVFAFNDALDQAVLRPVTWVYRTVLPEPVRAGISNFLAWLSSPVLLANNLLQGDVEQAGVTISRFFINGMTGGLGDPATAMGLMHRDEDFGQTLAVYGVGDGPYLVLPLLGVSNGRDALGRVVDTLVDPIGLFGHRHARLKVQAGRAAVSAVDFRDENFERIDDLRRDSIDYYATSRSIYRQHRANVISNGDLSGSPLFDLEPTEGTTETTPKPKTSE